MDNDYFEVGAVVPAESVGNALNETADYFKVYRPCSVSTDNSIGHYPVSSLNAVMERKDSYGQK